MLVPRSLSSYRISDRQGLARVSPLEGMSPVTVVITNVFKHFVSQILFARKASSLQEVFGEEGKPDLDLVKPRGMKGKEMKDDSFVGSLKNAFLFLLRHFPPAQAAQLGDQLSHLFRQVRFEIVHNQMNLLPGMLFHHPPQEFTELSGAVTLRRTPQEFSRMRVKGSEEIHRPVSDVTKFPQGRFPRQHRLVRKEPFQRLNSRLLIDAQDRTLGWRLQVKSQDPKHFPLKIGVRGIKPVPPLPGFEPGFMKPAPDRIQRNRTNDSFTDRFLLEESVTPSLKGPANLSGRLQDQLDKPMLGLRGKRRSELRYAPSLLDPSVDFLKNVSAISERFFLPSQDLWQSGDLVTPYLPPGSRALATDPFGWLYVPSTVSQARISQRPLTRSVRPGVLSLESPPFSSENYRLNFGTNLSNTVLVCL